MESLSRKRALLTIVLIPAVLLACVAAPTGPSAALHAKSPSRDEAPVPCDPAVVTDGTCVNGYIIPH
jgi:hypothetical protein